MVAGRKEWLVGPASPVTRRPDVGDTSGAPRPPAAGVGAAGNAVVVQRNAEIPKTFVPVSTPQHEVSRGGDVASSGHQEAPCSSSQSQAPARGRGGRARGGRAKGGSRCPTGLSPLSTRSRNMGADDDDEEEVAAPGPACGGAKGAKIPGPHGEEGRGKEGIQNVELVAGRTKKRRLSRHMSSDESDDDAQNTPPRWSPDEDVTRRKHIRWTPIEEQRLAMAVQKVGTDDWDKVKKVMVSHRASRMLMLRWKARGEALLMEGAGSSASVAGSVAEHQPGSVSPSVNTIGSSTGTVSDTEQDGTSRREGGDHCTRINTASSRQEIHWVPVPRGHRPVKPSQRYSRAEWARDGESDSGDSGGVEDDDVNSVGKVLPRGRCRGRAMSRGRGRRRGRGVSRGGRSYSSNGKPLGRPPGSGRRQKESNRGMEEEAGHECDDDEHKDEVSIHREGEGVDILDAEHGSLASHDSEADLGFSHIHRFEDLTVGGSQSPWLFEGSQYLFKRVLVRLDVGAGGVEVMQEGSIYKWRPRSDHSLYSMPVEEEEEGMEDDDGMDAVRDEGPGAVSIWRVKFDSDGVEDHDLVEYQVVQAMMHYKNHKDRAPVARGVHPGVQQNYYELSPPGGWPSPVHLEIAEGGQEIADDRLIHDAVDDRLGGEVRGEEVHMSPMRFRRSSTAARSPCIPVTDREDKEEVAEISLKLFSPKQSSYAVDAEQARRMGGGKDGEALCCPAGTALKLVLTARDIFGEEVQNKTMLDCVASRLVVRLHAAGDKAPCALHDVVLSRQRGSLEVCGEVSFGLPGSFSLTVGVGEAEALNPRAGITVNVKDT